MTPAATKEQPPLPDRRTFFPSRLARSAALSLVPQDGLHPGLQSLCERRAPLSVIEIPDIAEVPKVERDILLALRNQDYFSPERVSDARFIEHVRVATRAVAHHDTERSISETTS